MTGEKIGEDDDVWGGLSCMEMDLTNELYHHGVKGMKWGIRKKYKPHPRKKSHKHEEEPQQHRKGLTDKQKKYIKIGVGIAATALVAYGSYRLYKSGKLDGLIGKGKAALQGSSDEINIGGFSTKKKPKNVKEAIRGLNRYRGTNQSNNCSMTAMAAELSYRGIDIEAKGSAKGVNLAGAVQKVFKNPDIRDVALPRFRTKAAIEKAILKRYPEGARGAISVAWKPERLSSSSVTNGHSFSWIVEQGKVRFFDAQTENVDVGHYFKFTDPNKMMSYMRLDNLEIDFENAKEFFINRKR